MPRRQSRQVWRTLDFQATTSAPEVSEPFQEDEVIIVGAEPVMPTVIPIIVDAMPFEPEVIIQREIIDLTREQRAQATQHGADIAFERLKEEHVGYQKKIQADADMFNKIMDLWVSHIMKLSAYNDNVMTVCCRQMADADKEDPPYIQILIAKDRILPEAEILKMEIPYKMRGIDQSLMVICASPNRGYALDPDENDPRISADHRLIMKMPEFIELPHSLKQSIYDPMSWMWVHELDEKSLKDYFKRPFTAAAVAEHFESIRVDEGDQCLPAKDAAAAIKKSLPSPDLLEKWRWEEAKNNLFKDLEVK